MSQVIVFTADRRVRYMAEVLESWSKVRGVSESRLLFHCEPGCPEMADLCASAIRFARQVTVTVNPDRLGVLVNPHSALCHGFEHDDFVILAEDDVVVADDSLEYFAWCREQYAADQRVISASAFQRYDQPGGPAGVLLGRFSGLIWGTWRDRWAEKLAPDWDFDYSHNGWDWRINDYWVKELGHAGAAPCQSRSQHIGREGGEHCHSDAVYEETWSPSFRAAYGVQEYREVPG